MSCEHEKKYTALAEDNTEMFQEPILALILQAAPSDGLRLCGGLKDSGDGSTLLALGGVAGEISAQLRVEPGFQVQEKTTVGG